MINQIMEINILQQPPFRFVDRLIDYSNKKQIRCSYVVKADNPMVDSGHLSAEGLIECLAQTASVKSSIDDPLKAKNVGYLASVKNYEITGTASIGDELVIDLDLIQEVMQFSIYNASAFINDRLIATCELRIFDTGKE